MAARQRRGNAVVIASTAALFGEAGHADYAAAKAALAWGLTRSLKNELARHITGQVLVVAGGMEGRGSGSRKKLTPPPLEDGRVFFLMAPKMPACQNCGFPAL